jgi:hypothetical protein
MEACINDLEAAVPQRSRDNLGAPVMAIEAGFSYQDT